MGYNNEILVPILTISLVFPEKNPQNIMNSQAYNAESFATCCVLNISLKNVFLLLFFKVKDINLNMQDFIKCLN